MQRKIGWWIATLFASTLTGCGSAPAALAPDRGEVGAGVPLVGNGWTYYPMTAIGRTLAHEGADGSRFLIACKDTALSVSINGFTPAQQWPQPKLAVGFRDVVRSGIPDLAYAGGDNRLALQFPLVDSVLHAVHAAQDVEVRFASQSTRIPAPPKAMARDFADRCSAPIPAGMRAG